MAGLVFLDPGFRRDDGGSAESWMRKQMFYDLWQVEQKAATIHVGRFLVPESGETAAFKKDVGKREKGVPGT